jgi:hypothetical protein
MTKTDQFCLSCHCVHGAMCPPHEVRPSGVEGLQESFRAACEEIERLKKRADRGCHSACMEHDILSVSHHPNCVSRNLRDEIRQLRAELAEERRLKDEARCQICSLEAWSRHDRPANTDDTVASVAKERGWGYLYEKEQTK